MGIDRIIWGKAGQYRGRDKAMQLKRKGDIGRERKRENDNVRMNS